MKKIKEANQWTAFFEGWRSTLIVFLRKKRERRHGIRLKPLFMAVLMVLSLVVANPVLAADVAGQNTVGSGTGATENNAEYLKQLIDFILNNYKGQVTTNRLIEGALDGMFDVLDVHSTYYSPFEFESVDITLEGEYKGLGMIITLSNDKIMVDSVFEGSPADLAGIYTGDIIISVNGISVEGKSLDEVGFMLRGGDGGGSVRVALKRAGVSEIIYKDVTPDYVRINPVKHKMLSEDIGYIKLSTFSQNSAEFFKKALDSMDQQGVGKLVIDLRDNTGGLLDQVVEIAKMLIPEGPIVTIDYKSETDKTYYSTLKNPKYKLAVLVNGNSASASEILAGAVQDTGIGKLIGTQTYGKGSVQSLVPILKPEVSAAIAEKYGEWLVNAFDLQKFGIQPTILDIIGYSKLTIAQYLTPAGRMIDGIGLTPDVEIEEIKDLEIHPSSVRMLGANRIYEPGVESMEVMYIKAILKLAGYEVDGLDMIMDEQTVESLKEFQRQNGLPVTGIADMATQNALNKKWQELELMYDVQLSRAVNELEID